MAEHLEPKHYNVSVKRAEAVAIFEEHRPVTLKTARRTVEKAGFSYLGADLVARGHLSWSGQPGESELLLTDPKADMTLRLAASDTESVFGGLQESFRRGELGDTVQVRGPAVESREADDGARSGEAPVTLSVTGWSPGSTAKLPPLVPERDPETASPRQDQGWF